MKKKDYPRLSNRELEIMNLIWDKDTISAAEIANHFLNKRNQFKNSTYTFINKLLEKGVIKRQDPGFICIPLYEKDDLLLNEAHYFLDKIYQGSFNKMFAQFIQSKTLSEKEILEIKTLIEKAEDDEDSDNSSR